MSVCEAYTNPFASACYLHERFNECTEAVHSVHCKQKWRPSHRVNWNKNVGRYFLPCILISWNLVSISPILRYVYQINKISIQKAVNPKQILLSWQPFAILVQFCSNRPMLVEQCYVTWKLFSDWWMKIIAMHWTQL